ERERPDLQLAGERGRLGERVALLLLVLEHLQRRDADDRALSLVAELVAAQDHLERLIPRQVLQQGGDRCRRHRRVDDDVEPARGAEDAQDLPEIGVLEIERDRLAAVLLLLAGRLRRQRRRQRRRRRLRWWGLRRRQRRRRLRRRCRRPLRLHR